MSSQHVDSTPVSPKRRAKGIREEKSIGAMAPAGKSERSRGPGRPRAEDGSNTSRLSILRCALRLTKTTPLQDLSILMVARSMNVAPGLIHYYIGGRDWLTSGVVNLFYRDLLRIWPKEVGDWQADLIATAKTMYDHLVAYSGVCAYIASNHRFRIFQLAEFSDRDWGVEFLERFSGRVHAAGLPGARSATYVHILMNFVINCAHNTTDHIYPGQHNKMIEERIALLDPQKYPNIFFGQETPARINGAGALEEGCRLILLGMTNDLMTNKNSLGATTSLNESPARPNKRGRKTNTK
jgi:AcrR family transcriptional regulator